MPIAKVNINGRIGRFEVPEGTTSEQAEEMARASMSEEAGGESGLASELARGLGLTARGVVQGAAAIPSMVADAPISIYNELTGRNLPSAAYSIEQGLTRLGLPQPEGALERFSTGVTEGLSGIGAGVKGAQALAKGAGPVVRGISQTLSTALPQQAAAVTGGVAGQEIASGLGAGPIGQAVGALAGSFAPAAMSSMGKGVAQVARYGITGYGARNADELKAIAKGQKSQASALRNEMRDMQVSITPSASSKLVGRLNDKLKDFDLDPDLSPVTNSIVAKIKNAAAGGKVNLNYLDQYRRQLRGARQEDSAIAGAVRSAIDDVVNNLSPKDFDVKGGERAVKLLNQFRKDWAKASKLEAIADVLQKADGDPNRIKAGLTRFLNKEKNTVGFNGGEVAALKEAARSGTTEKILKMGGKFGIDMGTSLTAGNTALPVISGAVTGSALIPVIGTGMRSAQKYVARGKAEELLRVIEAGGRVTNKQISKLPTEDAINIMRAIRGLEAAKATQGAQ